MNKQQNIQKPSGAPADFIPARESPVVIWFFKWYTWFLCKRRFEGVFLQQDHAVDRNQSVLFVLNHHSWWDGLIPLLLNEFVFRQRARAIMEDKQMRQFPFFSRIGAMSVNRVNPRSALYTLTLASQWLRESGTSLYLYPEGKITNPALPIEIESGFLRISQQAPGSLLIPVALFISHRKSSKPVLFIRTGKPCSPTGITTKEKTESIAYEMNKLLDQVRHDSLSDHHGYKRLV